jgi:hypothetical protein
MRRCILLAMRVAVKGNFLKMIRVAPIEFPHTCSKRAQLERAQASVVQPKAKQLRGIRHASRSESTNQRSESNETLFVHGARDKDRFT